MVTRSCRLNDFISSYNPDPVHSVQLLCEDQVGTYVIPFPCKYTNGMWLSTTTGEILQAKVVGWREFRQRTTAQPRE